VLEGKTKNNFRHKTKSHSLFTNRKNIMAENSTETKTEKTPLTDIFQPNRTYLMTIDTVTAVKSSKKGTPGFKVSLVGVPETEVAGTRLIDTLWNTAATKWKIANMMKAAGVQKLTGQDDLSLYKAFAGKHVMVRTNIEKGGEDGTGGFYDDTVRIANFIGDNTNKESDAEIVEETASTNVPF
jgi:hypothetical protein